MRLRSRADRPDPGVRSKLSLSAVLAVALTTGCAASVASRADDALKRHQYLEAAELYDQVVRKDPKDTKAIGRRTEARNAVLRELLAETARLRAAGQLDAATSKLAEMLVRRDSWMMKVDAQTDKELTVEVVAAGSAIATSVTRTAGAAGPLSAEQMAMHYAPLLAHHDFQNWRREIEDSVHTAGAAVCTSLEPRATTPYLSWAIASYCKHFGVDDVKVLARANLRTGVMIEGSIVGIPPEDTVRIRETLTGAFRESVWFSPSAARSARGNFGGKITATFDAKIVSRTANWVEQVPYTDYESRQESYQEPYNDTEYYQEQVPHTEYHSESHPCGSSTCSESVPTTVYSSESRTRSVTKYRTAYRSVTVPVTKYRDVPRSFSYEAIERTGRYVSSLRIRVDRESLDVAADVSGDFFEHGFDHDVTNVEAGVSPSRANLPALADFTAREEGRLRDELRAKLDARYADLYCTAKSFTVEEAAACAYLAPARVPMAVHTTLHGVFGADEELLPAVLTR
ncbi:hypothetical protein BH11MYX3_BH11MYX3_38340 [soil metagenome]